MFCQVKDLAANHVRTAVETVTSVFIFLWSKESLFSCVCSLYLQEFCGLDFSSASYSASSATLFSNYNQMTWKRILGTWTAGKDN